MKEKIKISKWFDEFIKNFGRDCDKGKLVAVISHCKYYETYDGYSSIYGIFNKKEYEEIRDRFEDYVRVILDGDYEVEEEKTPLGWKPKNDDVYWYVGSNGDIWSYEYDNVLDERVFKYTKVFKTKEEAEFEAEKMKVTRELERYACEFEPGVKSWFLEVEFEKDEDDYIAGYDLELEPCTLDQHSGVCFETIVKGREAIKAVGEDRVLKYYFGVEND